jgi:hypothetical protein
MAKKVFESHELSEYIYAFSNQGYDEHQEKLHRVFGEMFQADFGDVLTTFYTCYYDSSMRFNESPHIVECLQQMYDDDELQEFAQSMRWCRCRDNPGRRCHCRRLYPIFKENELA